MSGKKMNGGATVAHKKEVAESECSKAKASAKFF
jgi:hypothetical protein